MSDELARHRLFFALLPDDEARERIVRLAQLLKQVHRVYAEPIKPRNLHVSLFHVDAWRGVPPGHLLGGALAAGAAVKAAPFRLAFDQTGSFAGRGPAMDKSRSWPFVLFGEGGGAIQSLRRAMAAQMRRHGLGYAVKDVRAFAPHVTLWWDSGIIEARPVARFGWTVRDLVLVDSLQGLATHNHLARWPLGA
ncbi:MAG TPA: 2'-5' RNA ligase family protein [Rhizomicrobium sp.]